MFNIWNIWKTGKYRIIKNGLDQFIIQEQYLNPRTGETWDNISAPAYRSYKKAKQNLDRIVTEEEVANKRRKLLEVVEVVYET